MHQDREAQTPDVTDSLADWTGRVIADADISRTAREREAGSSKWEVNGVRYRTGYDIFRR